MSVWYVELGAWVVLVALGVVEPVSDAVVVAWFELPIVAIEELDRVSREGGGRGKECLGRPFMFLDTVQCPNEPGAQWVF